MARTSADIASSRVVRLVALLTVAILGFSITVSASGAPSAPSVVQISASGDHTCAVMSGGGVKCWGANWYGQLGNGKPPAGCGVVRKCLKQSSGTPVDVVGLGSGVKAVTAGGYHSCALTSRGGVKCWGYNATGQLGNGVRACPSLDVCARARSSTPVDVIGLSSGVRAVAAGGFYTCALMINGGVKCWGANRDGQLGNRSGDASSRPVDVAGLSSGVSTIVAGGRYSCAVTVGGAAKCWGSSPAVIPGLASGVLSVAVSGSATDSSDSHACALMSSGGVKCWGSNSGGQLGNGSLTHSETPVDVVGLTSGIQAIAVGGSFTCALTSGGGVKCWGPNSSGELGNGSQTDSRVPVDVAGLRTGVEAITAGTISACAFTSRGEAKCWGSNYRGILGTGTAIKLSRKPVDVRFSAKPSTKPSAPSSGSPKRCSEASARRIVKQLLLGDPSVANPVYKVLCGAFTGPGSQTMVVSLGGPGASTGMIDWVVFRWAGGTWQFLMKRHQAAVLTAAGSDIKETVSIFRDGDPRCCPSGGTRTRIWYWNGSRFVASRWKQVTPGATVTPVGGGKSGYFKTPSGNIVCGYGPLTGFRSTESYVACRIKSGLKPPPPVRGPGCFSRDEVSLRATGRTMTGRSICPGEPEGDAGVFAFESVARVLGYGETWSGGGLRCTSAETGLTCRNRSGHGFFLSRERWRRF